MLPKALVITLSIVVITLGLGGNISISSYNKLVLKYNRVK